MAQFACHPEQTFVVQRGIWACRFVPVRERHASFGILSHYLHGGSLPSDPAFDIFLTAMYRDFHAADRWTRKEVHCLYQALIVAVATRHADAVDIKFLADGRTVWIALPLPAWAKYKEQTGKVITDLLAIEIAGHYLKTALESGEGVGREMYSLTVDETLKHLEAVVTEPEAQPTV